MSLREQVQALERTKYALFIGQATDGRPPVEAVPLQAVLDLIDANEDRIAYECYLHAEAAVAAALDRVEAEVRQLDLHSSYEGAFARDIRYPVIDREAVIEAIEAERPKP